MHTYPARTLEPPFSHALSADDREQLSKIQTAQEIVVKTTDAQTHEEIMRCCAAIGVALTFDIAVPVETLVDDALRILGVGQ